MANGDGGTGEIFVPMLKALQPIGEPLGVPHREVCTVRIAMDGVRISYLLEYLQDDASAPGAVSLSKGSQSSLDPILTMLEAVC
jgi:hypothetical protein